MKKNIYYKSTLILTVLLVSMLLVSCASDSTKQSIPETKTSQKKPTQQTLSKADREKYRTGITALNNNELPKAQRIFHEFIRSQPKLAGGYSNLALTYFKMNKIKKSLKQVNKALQLNSQQAQALNLRAQVYVINGQIHKAKEDYIHAIKVKPKYINAQYNLALLYGIYLQEIELAIKHYRIYISLLNESDEATLEWIKHLEGTLSNA